MARYAKRSQQTVRSAMQRYKRGELRSGKKGKAKSRRQAIAIGLSEARREGVKVPLPPSRSRRSGSKRSGRGRKTA